MSVNCIYYALPMFILIMLITSYYMYILCLCTLLKINLLETCTLLLFYNIIFVMLVWSFLSTVFTPLAEVPLEYKLTTDEAAMYERSNQQDRHLFLQNIVRKKNLDIQTLHEHGYIRYCFYCKQIKPDRAHHCSTCKMCVLRMDHHCPWVNNCVGYSNYKCFVLFMFYCVIYSGYSVATSYQFIFSSWDGDTNLEFLPVVVGFALAAILGLVGVMFLLFNCNLLLQNETTLERMKIPNFIQPNASFGLGCKRNFLEVFGTNCLLWPLPFFTGLGTGYTFPIRR